MKEHLFVDLDQIWPGFCVFCLFSEPQELKWIIQEVNYRIGIQSAKLVRQLKRKDRLHHKQQKKCDIVTACLQAVSPKRSKS